MPKGKSHSQVSAEAYSAADYNQIAASAKIRDVKLISSKSDIHPLFFHEYDGVKLNIDNTVENVNFIEESGLVIAIFGFEVKGSLKRKRVFHCKANFLTVYELPEDSNAFAAKAFCNRVGFFAAYPYFRALFAHITDLQGAELPILPVLSSPSVEKESRSNVEISPEDETVRRAIPTE